MRYAHATRGWWVEGRAAAAYADDMIGAGFTAEEAEKAVDRSTLKEEQRMKIVQRYWDYPSG